MKMDGSTTLTVRLPTKIKKKLGRLAESTDRTKSYHAATAIIDYVERQERIDAELKGRLERVRSGKVKLIPHKEVMDEVDALIDSIERRKKR
jgi:predicted transcriptional regulator